MKNIELLNICYKYFNRFVVADELVKLLTDMDKNKLSKKEIEYINSLVDEIKAIIKNTSNEEDEFIISKKKNIVNCKDKLEKIPKNNDNEDFFNERIKGLDEEYNKPIDNYERWIEVFKTITSNDYFNESFDNLTDYELLEFLAQYIKAPFPPTLDQEEFDRLVKVGIEHDEREWLWRLAFNYEEKNLNLNEIMDYYIKVKDGYYIGELISAVGNVIDIDRAIDKINDKELIKDLYNRKQVMNYYVTENQFKKLFDKIK